MNFATNKEKGNSALGIAIAYFTTSGYVVFGLFLCHTWQFHHTSFSSSKKAHQKNMAFQPRQIFFNSVSRSFDIDKFKNKFSYKLLQLL